MIRSWSIHELKGGCYFNQGENILHSNVSREVGKSGSIIVNT